jgi:hypothetical protein
MRPLLIAVTTVFTAFTLWIFSRTGMVGFYEQLLASPAAWQVFADLTVALLLVLGWMWRDAQARERAFWPYLVLTLALGSIGPLTYLLLRPPRQAAVGHSASAT